MLSVLVITICFSLSPRPTVTVGSSLGTSQMGPTLDQLRETVFRPACVSCHSRETPAGGLELDRYAYADLVDVSAENPGARVTEKLRVVPGKPDDSFLYQKLTGNIGPDEGGPAPHDKLLTADQLTAVREWILRGALPTSTRDIMLRQPPAGAQVVVPPFEVPMGREIQGEYTTTLSNTQEMRVIRFEELYPPGSHHLNFFAYQGCNEDICPMGRDCVRPQPDGTFRETFDSVPFCSWALRAGNQRIHQIWDLPPGVAFKFDPFQTVMAQIHFVNTGQQTAPIGGTAVINLHAAADPTQAPITMGTIFGQNFKVELPPRSTTLWDFGFTFDLVGKKCAEPSGPDNPPIITGDVKIAAVNGHFHWRGKTFEVRLWDGLNRVQSGPTRGAPVGCAPCRPGQDTSFSEFDRMGRQNQIYRSDNWDDPPFITYSDNPIQLPASWGIVYRVTFVNNTNMTIKFGPHVEFEEHANVFVYFYPGPPDGRTLAFPLCFQN
jgi:hypothetical protein